MAFGPVAQAAGLSAHGACRGTDHAQRDLDAAATPSDSSDAVGGGQHARHAATPADEVGADAGPTKADGKCACGCLCAAGHACTSTLTGAVADVRLLALNSVQLAPSPESLGFPSGEPSPRTRPPIDAFR